MEKEARKRAVRNRTITLAENELDRYLAQCLRLNASDAALEPSALTDRIIFGDAFEAFALLPDAFIDLLIADPPYNLSKTFGESTFKRMDGERYAAFTEDWIKKLKRSLKPDASVYVCCDWKSSLIVGEALSRHFHILNRITWQREKGRGAKRNWKNSMEDIWFATVSGKNYTFNVDDVKMRRRVIAPYKVDGQPKDWIESEAGSFRDTYPSNFWDDVSVPYWSMPENTDHPTQKPEKLMARLILASSNEGGMVFDPFSGSGTTAVAAKKLNRRFLGIECEREYCALSQKRLELAESDSGIQGYSDGVFWERNTLAFQKKLKNGTGTAQMTVDALSTE